MLSFFWVDQHTVLTIPVFHPGQFTKSIIQTVIHMKSLIPYLGHA